MTKAFHILKAASFACLRACTPGIECMFGPIFRAIGSTRVVSHTVKLEVKLRDRDALAAAVAAMGGTVLGEGVHRMFSGNPHETGFGFRLPGWSYPLILRADNTLAFDDYHGHWGDVKDLDKLNGHYAIEAGRLAAEAHCWMTERQGDSLLIYHPSGATMTVHMDGTVESAGFVGTGCDVASAIENAIGNTIDRTNSQEYFAEQVHIVE
jgi:hypothetical protein